MRQTFKEIGSHAVVGMTASFAWVTLSRLNEMLQVCSSAVGLVIACFTLYVMVRRVKKTK